MDEPTIFRDPANRDEEAWRVMLGGKVLPASWSSKGAAKAGAQVEARRLAAQSPADQPAHT